LSYYIFSQQVRPSTLTPVELLTAVYLLAVDIHP
jgi:hypothetical protein